MSREARVWVSPAGQKRHEAGGGGGIGGGDLPEGEEEGALEGGAGEIFLGQLDDLERVGQREFVQGALDGRGAVGGWKVLSPRECGGSVGAEPRRRGRGGRFHGRGRPGRGRGGRRQRRDFRGRRCRKDVVDRGLVAGGGEFAGEREGALGVAAVQGVEQQVERGVVVGAAQHAAQGDERGVEITVDQVLKRLAKFPGARAGIRLRERGFERCVGRGKVRSRWRRDDRGRGCGWPCRRRGRAQQRDCQGQRDDG